MSAESTFRAKAPWIMQKLMDDFPIGVEDAAAIVGNLGHESGGLTVLQEVSPTVAGSRGGYGWAQWTGPRRRDFEAYCQRNGLDPASDKANYAWLFLELQGSEKRAIAAVVAADGLDAKVEAFEMAYERAGVKHYSSRKAWARRAMEAWADASTAAKSEPAPIGHNGGPTLDAPAQRGTVSAPAPVHPGPDRVSAPAKPVPTPVEQSNKAVGAGKGAAQGSVLAGAIITLLLAADILPANLDTAEVGAALGIVLTAISSGVMAMVQSYRAAPNAEPQR